jgi:hypothetical protein
MGPITSAFAVEATGKPRMHLLIGKQKLFLLLYYCQCVMQTPQLLSLNANDSALSLVLLCLMFQELMKKLFIVCS